MCVFSDISEFFLQNDTFSLAPTSLIKIWEKVVHLIDTRIEALISVVIRSWLFAYQLIIVNIYEDDNFPVRNKQVSFPSVLGHGLFRGDLMCVPSTPMT